MSGTRLQQPIAIVGVGCRFPGARNLDAYASLLFEGRCALAELPAHRFDQARYYDPVPGVYGKSYSRIGGCVEETPFDHGRLGLPAEAGQGKDRAPLWALEAAGDALADAGFGPSGLRGSNTAVVLGHARGSTVAVDLAFATGVEELLGVVDEADRLRHLTAPERRALREAAVAVARARYPREAADNGAGRVTSAVAGLVSAAFGLTGRHLVVDAACASSFAAMQVAARALSQGRMDLALAGGVSFSQEASVILFAQSRALSAEGSFPFDARANGFVPADGVGIVVLERLEDALARGRRIHGVIRGIGASCDGKGKGLWAPRKEGQVLAMERALARAGVDLATIGLVEAHGTSTALGDATEVAALTEVLGGRLSSGRAVPIGSVKGNIGHCREAAGVAGLIKVLLALGRESVPPSIGYRHPNPDIHWERTPFRIASETAAWPRGASPRTGIVNSFGIGGLNYQVIVEEPPRPERVSVAVAGPAGAEPLEPIAIVGLGCLFPGARGAAELWARLLEGHRAQSDVPASRWSADVYTQPGGAVPWRTYSARGGFLTGFTPDWRRYGMPPALVEQSDPLQFMLLEAALDALADARIDAGALDKPRVAVVVGSGFGSDFALALTLALRVPEAAEALAGVLRERGWPAEEIAPAIEEMTARLRARLPRISEDSSGSFSSSTLASRLAKTLDLQGPTFSVDAACASSLAALEAASEALREGDCDLVLCAGGDRSLRVQRFEALSQAGLLSRSGRGTPFDAEADGLVPAEGAGVCVLKRLSDAQAAGDRVYAVVREVGSASDGEWKDIHEPSPRGLALAVRRAYAAGGADTRSLDYVEAHGGGWPAADTAEIDALHEVFGARARPLLLGTVKANIGHAQAASGMAGLVKAALCLRESVVPATPGLTRPTPRLAPGLEVATEQGPLPRRGVRGRAGVSALGLGGVSYHALLESAPPPSAAEPVVVRVATRDALPDALARLISMPPQESWTTRAAWGSGPVALGLQGGPGLEERARKGREGIGRGAEPLFARQGLALVTEPLTGGLCALFPGQGAQYPGMLEEVAAAYPRAAAVLDHCDRVLRRLGQEPLSEVLWGDEQARLEGVRWTPLAVLAGGLMMREVAASHGLQPDLVSGHSYGEYAALVAAGSLSLEQAIAWTLARSAAIESEAPRGSMLAVFAPRARVDALLGGLPGYATVANVNTPEQVVVSGEEAALAALAARCAAAGVEGRRIPVPGAFHSELMAGAAARFAHEVAGVTLSAPRVRLLSSIGAHERTCPHELREGLVAQFTAPVDFVAQIEQAYAAGFRRFVELGPGSSLSRMVGAILGERPHLAVSLDDRKEPGVAAVARALAALRAAEAGEGRPLPGGDEPASLFEPAEWRALSAQPGFPAFWRATRPSLQVFARHLFEQSGGRSHGESPPAETRREATGIRFFDATAGRTENGHAATDVPIAAAPARAGVDAPSPATNDATGGRAAEVRGHLLDLVVGCTGYPVELLDLDADLEADLGIDSVKQAQIFGRLRERYDLATDDRVVLRDFPTLRRVIDYVVARLDGVAVSVARPEGGAAAPETVAVADGDDDTPIVSVAPATLPAAALPLLRLRGSPFEMGLQHGREQREPIRETVDAYMRFLGRDGITRPVLQKALDRPTDHFDEEALDEIRGLAEGSVLDVRYLLAYNLDSALFPEYGSGCTHVGLGPSAHGHAGHAGVLHAVNEDSPLALHLGLALPRVVQVREPARGRAHVLFSLAGQIGGINGVSAAGLVATSCALLDRSEPGRGPGLLHPLLVRKVLQEADGIAGAVAIVREARRCGAWSVLLSHAAEPHLRCLEYDRETIAEAGPLDRHWTANHGVIGAPGPVVPDHSRHRLERLRELLPGEGARVGVADLQAALRDRFDRGRARPVAHRTMNTVCRVDNVLSLVADVAGGRLTVAGPAGDADAGIWRELDLAALFGTGPWKRSVPVMTRYVVRAPVEPLGEVTAGRYRPERVMLVGDGAVARELRGALAGRGARVFILALDPDPERLVAAAEAAWSDGPLPDVCLLSALARVGDPPGLAALAASWGDERPRLLEGPFRLLQAWARRLAPDEARTLFAVTAQGGSLGQDHVAHGHPEGGAVAGLLRALRRELPGLRVKRLDTEAAEAPARVVDALLRELDSGNPRTEAGLLRGTRRVLRLLAAPARVDPARLDALAAVPYVILTGGGRGITAEVALGLARRGVRRFHLLGRTALPPQLDEWCARDTEGRERLRQEVLERLRATRGRVTPVEWEQAFAPIARALEVGDTLRRIATAGASGRYHAVEMADRAAVTRVLDDIRAQDGPVEAIVHGAGFERSRAFASQPPEDWRATLDPKADGTLHLAALTAGDPLRFFVAFSSVAGRFGGLGQAGYSMACELQTRLVGAHAALRPGCRSLAIGWPAWDEVGMAARGDVRARLQARGRRLLPVREGVEHFLAELTAAGADPEVTYIDGVEGLDLDGLVTAPAVRPGAAEAAEASPLVDVLREAGGEAVSYECGLDPERDAFLSEHRLDGVPVLPAVAALEMLAEGARLAGLGDHPRLEGVSVESALRVPRGRACTAIVEAAPDAAPGRWATCLRADVVGRDGRLMEAGRVFVRGLARAAQPLAAPAGPVPARNGNGHPAECRVVPATYAPSPRGDVRRRVVHGPAFQTLREVLVSDGDTHVAVLVARPAASLRARRRDAAWMIAAPVLDGCLQACGVIARLRLDVLALPSRFGSVQTGRGPRDGEECRAHIRLRGRLGEHVHFDFTLCGEDGAPLLQVEDYAARAFAAIAAPARRPVRVEAPREPAAQP